MLHKSLTGASKFRGVSLSFSLSVYVSFLCASLSVYPSLSLSLSLFMYFSLCASFCVSLSFSLFVYVSFSLCLSLCVFLSFSLSLCIFLFASLSVCLPLLPSVCTRVVFHRRKSIDIQLRRSADLQELVHIFID